MSDMFYIGVAGLLVEVRPASGRPRKLCTDYIVDGGGREPDLVVDLASEIDDIPEVNRLLRAISERGTALGLLYVHGVAVEHGGRAYLFCAPSGTGKSTHAFLWQKCLGEASARIINGDKPFVRVPGEGPCVAYGSPWCGKEKLNVNTSAPLAGICFLERAEPGESRIEPIAPAEVIPRALKQVYLPRDAAEAGRMLELLDVLLARTPLWLLHADMSEDAVRTSFEALTGEGFDDARVTG